MPAKYTPEKRIAKFHERIDRSGGEDACWPWLASKSRQGYGLTTWDGAHVNASRVAYMLAYGEFPRELFVLHKCDNPQCCNPRHLFLGTQSDNMKDMARKNRHPPLPRHNNHAHGEAASNTKLTTAQVEAIRQRYAQGGIRQVDLAVEYGVTQTAISAIVRRTTWSRYS